MRIFLFANQGHGSVAVKAALSSGAEIIGVCSAPLRPWWRRTASAFRHRPFRDPFAQIPHPSKIPGVRIFPSRDLGVVRQFLVGNRPDLILCCSFHRLIPAEIFTLAKAAYNIHPGLLPERGGGTPNRWAIRESDTEAGVTAHVLSNTFDGGDIVWQRRMPITPDVTWGDLEMELKPLVMEAVEFLLAAETKGHVLPRTKQTPRLQKSYRGEAYRGQSPEECRRICRSTLPKFCGLGLPDCRSRSPAQRPCGLTLTE